MLEQVGKQINASVLLLINKIEFSIYRFLVSRAKMPKKQPRSVELEVDRFTSRWTLNVWQVTVRPQPILDRTLTGNSQLID